MARSPDVVDGHHARLLRRAAVGHGRHLGRPEDVVRRARRRRRGLAARAEDAAGERSTATWRTNMSSSCFGLRTPATAICVGSAFFGAASGSAQVPLPKTFESAGATPARPGFTGATGPAARMLSCTRRGASGAAAGAAPKMPPSIDDLSAWWFFGSARCKFRGQSGCAVQNSGSEWACARPNCGESGGRRARVGHAAFNRRGVFVAARVPSSQAKV